MRTDEELAHAITKGARSMRELEELAHFDDIGAKSSETVGKRLICGLMLWLGHKNGETIEDDAVEAELRAAGFSEMWECWKRIEDLASKVDLSGPARLVLRSAK